MMLGLFVLEPSARERQSKINEITTFALIIFVLFLAIYLICLVIVLLYTDRRRTDYLLVANLCYVRIFELCLVWSRDYST